MQEIMWMNAALGGILGLVLGSFLNVVIHRMPKMLERQWAQEYADLQGLEATPAEPYNLMRPASGCPSARTKSAGTRTFPC